MCLSTENIKKFNLLNSQKHSEGGNKNYKEGKSRTSTDIDIKSMAVHNDNMDNIKPKYEKSKVKFINYCRFLKKFVRR